MGEVSLHLSLDTLVIIVSALVGALYYFNRRDGDNALALSHENALKIERIIGALEQCGIHIDV